MLTRILLMLFAILASNPAFAERKVALLMGNSEYSAPATVLKNPPNDIVSMKKMLVEAGFEVSVLENAGRSSMSRALVEFEEKAAGAEVGLIYYSGHGIELNGDNFLIPIDATLASDRDLKYEAVALDDILQALAGVTKLKLVLLDACRDNPFLTSMKRMATRGIPTRGLARIETTDTNMLVGYATAPGTVALDGEGENSPYTAALVRHLITPGLEIEAALRAVAKDVYQATDGRQRPFKSGSLFETVMLGPEKDVNSTGPEAAAPDVCAEAAAHWGAIASRDSAALLEEHIRLFATCPFAGVARHELDVLRKNRLATPSIGDRQVSQCDRLAAAPNDGGKPETVAGVELPAVNADAAVLACQKAVVSQPNNARYLYQLGRAFRSSSAFADASTYYAMAAQRGYAAAENELGELYFLGHGVTQDHSTAIAWYLKAADQGNVAAMINLGRLYFRGSGAVQQRGAGLRPNAVESLRWFRRAADGGSAEAMGQVGLFYERGLVVSRDPSEAMRWYKRAAELGDLSSMTAIGAMLERGDGIDKEIAEAASWYTRAAELGDFAAMYSLANLFAGTTGGAPDFDRAAEWMEKALEHGYMRAKTDAIYNSASWPLEFRRALQKRMQLSKAYRGSADGEFGPATTRAVVSIFGRNVKRDQPR